MEYLDFELPIKELEDQLDKCQIIGKKTKYNWNETKKQIKQKPVPPIPKKSGQAIT